MRYGRAHFLTCSLLAAACTADTRGTDGGPVDGPYTVALTGIRSVCYDVNDGILAEEPYLDDSIADATTEIDAFLRPDGTLDLRHSHKWLPGTLDGGVITRIHRDADGRVDQTRTVQTGHSTISVRTQGIITPNAMSLTFTDRYVDEHNDCTTTTHAEGFRRRVWDATALDGYYIADYEFWDRACPPSDGVLPPPIERMTGRLDVAETLEGDLRFALHERILRFTAPLPTDSPTIAHDGAFIGRVQDLFGVSEIPIDGSAHGTARPESIALCIVYYDDPPANTCGYRIETFGRRLRPSRSAIENDYRMRYDVASDCVTVPRTRSAMASLYRTNDGSYELRDPGGTMQVTIDEDGTLAGSVGDLTLDRFTITFTGYARPPDLSYEVTVQQRTSSGSICTTHVSAFGEVRYVF